MRRDPYRFRRINYWLHFKLLIVCTLGACTRPQQLNSRQGDIVETEETLLVPEVQTPEEQEAARLDALYNPWNLAAPSLSSDGLGIWRQAEVAHVKPGLDTLATRMALLDYASHSVRLQTFILTGDETGQAFANKLIELARRGVNVTLLLDDTTAIFKGSQNLYFYLTSHGIKVHGYRPVWIQIANNPGLFAGILADEAGIEERFGNVLSTAQIKNHRFHEKMMIVDAEVPGRGIAMIGGTNIANEYYNIQASPSELKWRDQDIVVRGEELVVDLASGFESNLGDITTINKNSSFSDKVDELVSGARGLFGRDRAVGIELRPFAMQQLQNALARNVPLDWTRSNVRMIHHRPLHKEFHAESRFLSAIDQAQREVTIINPYFIPSEAMVRSLINAGRRGVRVRLLTNSRDAGDSAPVQDVGRTFYKELIVQTLPSNAGYQSVPIEIHEWGGHAAFKNGYSTLHAKYAIIDRQIVLIGSFNLDPRSQVFNSEVLLESDDRLLVARLIEQYNEDSGPGFSSLVSEEIAEGYISGGTDLEKLRRKTLSMFKVFL
jgi:putative cardiolipin synthase